MGAHVRVVTPDDEAAVGVITLGFSADPVVRWTLPDPRAYLDVMPAIIESSNPRNIPLYRRFDFEVLGTIQVGASPPVTPMLRQARSRARPV